MAYEEYERSDNKTCPLCNRVFNRRKRMGPKQWGARIYCSNSCSATASRTKHGHGKKKTPTYQSWLAMRMRCYRPSAFYYHRYGGRGIKVCERWDDFALFLADMGLRPSLEYSIDRYPNPDGNYEPGNCRWATASQQRRNWGT